MLRSCLRVVDYVVVYDTGSTDDTLAVCREVLASVPCRIDQGPFGDFAAARNVALSRVPQEMSWTLMLDADEHLVAADYPRLRRLVEDVDHDAWNLPRYNYQGSDPDVPSRSYPDYQRRLLRNLPYIRYAGRVHEHVTGVARWGFAPMSMTARGGTPGGPHVHHRPCMDVSVLEAKARFYGPL